MVRVLELAPLPGRLQLVKNYPTSRPMPDQGNHRAWAGYHGLAAVRAIHRYRETGHRLDLEDAVQSARLAWMHACRVGAYYYWKGVPK